ncbi:CASP-like protein 4A1 [Mercurialis annua]|uniref:CASP-like protein 4A1 n=1 Tax=Mercurialis annua TaxID=3986 RepID=UPI00216043AA|nr:CASP-like protein 4A1 [Mercurialis annua]
MKNDQQKHINNQENDLTQQPQRIQEQENDPQQHIQEPQNTHKQELHENQEQQHNHTITMSSTSSHGYVFSPPEALNHSTTYQSPPPDHSYVYSPSSPDNIKSAKPPSPPPPPSIPASKPGSKNQDPEAGIKKRSVLGRNNEALKRKTLLGCRILGFICCLVSFSVMAADKNQGWAIDSFYQYKEFRYCLSVNVICFVYSGLQACSLAFSLVTGRFIPANFRCLVDFTLDQVLTYLLLSASSSAAFRVEDWESNWGKDKFPSMAKSSVILSFLAFVAFALCSLLSAQFNFTPIAT